METRSGDWERGVETGNETSLWSGKKLGSGDTGKEASVNAIR